MGNSEISYRGQSFPKNEFVEELINENISLMDEVKQLTHEIEILKRRILLMECLNRRHGVTSIVKKAENCVVILVSGRRDN